MGPYAVVGAGAVVWDLNALNDFEHLEAVGVADASELVHQTAVVIGIVVHRGGLDPRE